METYIRLKEYSKFKIGDYFKVYNPAIKKCNKGIRKVTSILKIEGSMYAGIYLCSGDFYHIDIRRCRLIPKEEINKDEIIEPQFVNKNDFKNF